MMILILFNIIRKCILKLCTVAQKPNLMSFLLLCASCISLNNHILQSILKLKDLHKKDPRRNAFHIFGLKCCSHTNMSCTNLLETY